MALTGTSNEAKIWNYLVGKGMSEAGAAGLMGNLYAESGLNPQNLQNTYEKSLGFTDASYTEAVDNQTYSNFVKDSAGYGLAQWTYWSRKQNLLNYVRAAGKSIGDLETQLDFLYKELSESYSSVLAVLKTATDVGTASNSVLTKFECPANQGSSVQAKRTSYGQAYYDKYAQKGADSSMSNSSLVTYTNVTKTQKTSPRTHAIDTITIHCVVGQWTAKQICDFFANSDRSASCNYGVGKDGSIGLCVDEVDRSWCSSNAANDHRAITIETASDTTDPYAVTDAAYNALIKLVADICKRNNISKLVWSTDKNTRINHLNGANMTVHRDYASKACPGDYLYNRMGDIASQVNALLGVSTSSSTSASTSTTSTASDADLAVGDTVNFTGTTHYASSTAKTGSTCKSGKATITAKAAGKSHPYHLKAVSGGGSNVYGWVDASDVEAISESTTVNYKVRVTAASLNIRKGPGTGYATNGTIKDKGIYTIVEESTGTGASKWGKLKSGVGWISLDYCTKL